jgi:hypothetical protein
MTQVTYSISKDKIVLHKDGANLALSLAQLADVKQLLPEAEAALLAQMENDNANGKKRS